MINREWFRLHSGLVNSHKVQSLPDELFRAWTYILAAYRQGGDNPLTVDAAAFALREPKPVVAGWLEKLKEHKLLEQDDDGNYFPHDWHEWQYSDNGQSAERAKRYRENKRSKGNQG